MRKNGQYFKRLADAPDDLIIRLERRVSFNEVDIMGIVWFGKYPVYFEEGSAAMGRASGLSYENFKNAKLRAPAVQLKIDYHQPLYLDELFIIEARMVWTEAAKIITEYKLIKKDDTIAITGALMQLLVTTDGQTCLVVPELLEDVRKRWRNGEIKCKV